MKANDLRINNWYKSVKFGVPVQCELVDLMELYHRSDGAYNDPPIDEMFEPIQLSEEWLLKFGFTSDGPYDYFRLNGLEISWGMRIVNTGERYSFRVAGEFPDAFKISVSYIHHLQNLYFALTGTELELTK